MPRPGPLRRPTGFTVRRGRLSEFAMQRPKASATISSAALQKVDSLRAPIGPPEGWQRDAYGFYETIGELAEVLNETASSLERCDFRPVSMGASGSPDAFKETTDERVIRVWRAFVGPRGGKPELIRKAALHLQIAGESFLVGQPVKTEFGMDAGMTWEFLSGEEIRVENNGKTIKRNYGYAGMQPVELDADSYIARLWRSDPKFSERADCAVKHVLPICSEIVLLTQVVDAIAKSRLSAGILFVPDEMSFGPFDETEDDSDETDDIDPLTQELSEQLTAPVEDRTSAASLVPLIMRGPAEFADKIIPITIARDLDHMYQDLRLEAIKRLATGLDIPVEIMFGKGGLNHWTGYNIDADFITKHIAPVGMMIAEFLTAAYLRPMLVEFEGMTEEEAADYELYFDSSKITSRTDTGPNARMAYTLKQISALAYLRESGFDEADMPSPEERKERDLRALMDAEPVIFGPQIIGMLYPELAGQIVVPVMVPDQGPEEGPDNPVDPNNPLPQRGNPTGPNSDPVIDNETGQDEPQPRGPAGPRLEESLIRRLAEASDQALEQALKSAGDRLLDKMTSSGNKDMKAKFSQIPVTHVVSALTDPEYRSLRMKPHELWQGAWDTLAVRGKGWARQHFMDNGHSSMVADQKATVVMNVLVDLLESHLSAVVSRPVSAGPNGLRVPYEMIAFALEQAVLVGE